MIRPITTEKAVRLVELDNTMVIQVSKRESKKQIKEDFEKIFGVKIEKIRTVIKNNQKVAYIRLNKNNPAIDIATRLGMI